MIVLAARPGMGKTAFALNIAQYAAYKCKLPVGFFSLEMSREELMDRLLVSQADIDAWKLKTGRLDEDEFTKLSDAMGELYETPLYIDDTPGLSILEMRTKARRLQAEHGVRLIVVDYLQLARPVRNLDNRVQEVAEVSQGLKNLARELKVPVLALSQLSRQVESRGVKRPQLADLRESGAIEQDADVVMFLWRENDDDLESVKLDIAKHRNGALRSIDLRFKGDKVRFYGVDSKHKEKG
jgi:replicative DNA helicase